MQDQEDIHFEQGSVLWSDGCGSLFYYFGKVYAAKIVIAKDEVRDEMIDLTFAKSIPQYITSENENMKNFIDRLRSRYNLVYLGKAFSVDVFRIDP
jgi:hypothetical protein